MTSVEEIIASPVAGHEGQCLVCYSDLKYPTITPCGHNEVCGTCHLRLRFLHNDKKCPMCKTLNETVICDSTQNSKLFEDYPLWGNELGGDYKYREGVGMFFPTQYYHDEIEPLFGYQCIDCNEYDGTTPDENIYESQQQQGRKKKKKPPTPLRGLQDHLRNKHRLTLCQLCVDHKRDFISQLPRFTPSQLKIHQKEGDGQGSRGHPLCEFCRPKRFYDLAELHAHLARDHYKCHVCEKQGLQNQYFRNYESLEKHFELQHYTCQDAQCRAARFVVFENEIDLRAHEISTHGATSSGSTKIQLEFRYKRSNETELLQQDVPSDSDFQYGLDGQAFVPDDLEEENYVNTVGAPSEDVSHPLHLQRTNELRAHAAQIRNLRNMQEAPEAFPSLQGESVEASSANASLRIGWTNGGVASRRSNAMTTENFPSLPTASSTSAGSKKKRAALVRGSGVTSSRQFAAMTSAANASTTSGWNGTSSSNVAAAPMQTSSSSSFPSLASTTTTSTATRPKPPPPMTNNRESNLTQDNFPSLGGGTSSTRYTAAENFARKKPPPPSLTDFPPPPSASTRATTSVRQQVLSGAPKKPPAVDNVLDFPPPLSSNRDVVMLDEIKATLGTNKYKQLRKLTKEFAADSLAPDAYVDHAASLFEKGYADTDFWSFLPTLLSSCPNTTSAKKAQQYMEELRRNQGSSSVSSSSLNSGGWSNKPPKVTAAVASRPTAVAASSVASWSTPNTTFTAARSRPNSKKSSNAWSAGTGSSTVARASQKPGSVSAAAAAEQECSNKQGGTATKFMANKAKKAKKQQTKQSKKKEKDELRALAFGGK